MSRPFSCYLFLSAVLLSVATGSASAQTYSVTVTNLTKGQTFTPVLLATHSPSVRLFAPGTTASSQLQAIAEEGDTTTMAALLRGMTADVREVVVAAGLQTPAVSATFQIAAGGTSTRISIVSMLIPTNDAFVGLSGLMLPTTFDPVVVDLLAYDSGTEINDELCASIPGPSFMECGGAGSGGKPGRGEGAITVHNGMHGVGTMNRSLRDWRGPVARVTIQRVQ